MTKANALLLLQRTVNDAARNLRDEKADPRTIAESLRQSSMLLLADMEDKRKAPPHVLSVQVGGDTYLAAMLLWRRLPEDEQQPFASAIASCASGESVAPRPGEPRRLLSELAATKETE